jgi:MerR family copper efflux transcriptional regulator
MKAHEIASKSGVAKDTLRYYEKIGVISAPLRAVNGYRYYSDQHIKELKFIKFAQSVGFPLGKIKLAIPHLANPDPHCPILQATIREQVERIEQKMAELDNAKQVLLKWLVT